MLFRSQINDAVTGLDQQTQKNASIAADTREIALKADEIAKEIVRDASSKEFVGKNDIKIEDNRSQSKSNNTKVAHNINTKAAQTNTQIKKEIKSNVNEDEWESF